MDKPGMEKPRRLEDATAEYLAEIDLQFAEICKRDREEDTSEQKSILVENVFKEIASRTASAACDRRTNYIMEQMCFESGLELLIELMQNWAPYAVFLARNRFASHIIQAVLSRIGFLLRSTEVGPDMWRVLEEALLTFSTPLLMEISWLGKEMSASHVIRSCFSVMLGLPLIAERKGKKSKHQHSIGYSEPLEALLEEDHFYVGAARAIPVPAAFQQALVAAVEKLLTKSSHDLQAQIAEVSSCAIMTLLVRLLAGPDLVPEHGQRLLALLADKVMHLSGIGAEDFAADRANDRANSLFYTMAGDRMGSYFLETLFEAAPWPMFCNLLDQFALLASADTLLDYAKDASGNFVVQAVLKRLGAEMPRSRRLAGEALALLTGAQLEVAQELLQRRPMVLFWTLEATLKLKDEDLAQRAADLVWAAWAGKEGATDEELAAMLSAVFEVLPVHPKDKAALGVQGKGKPKGKGPPKGDESKVEEMAEEPEEVRTTDAHQVSAAKVLGALLRSSRNVRTRAGCVLALLSPTALKNIAITGALAKALLDVFFELFPGSVDLKALGLKLASVGGDLAMHFAGQHVLRKAYEASDLRGKEKWAGVLVAERERLSKTKEGRGALQLVNAELFERDAAAWRAAVKKQAKATQAMADITGPTPAVAPAQTAALAGGGKRPRDEAQQAQDVDGKDEDKDGEDDEEGGDEAKGKRKRKRRRAKASD